MNTCDNLHDSFIYLLDNYTTAKTEELKGHNIGGAIGASHLTY